MKAFILSDLYKDLVLFCCRSLLIALNTASVKMCTDSKLFVPLKLCLFFNPFLLFVPCPLCRGPFGYFALLILAYAHASVSFWYTLVMKRASLWAPMNPSCTRY